MVKKEAAIINIATKCCNYVLKSDESCFNVNIMSFSLSNLHRYWRISAASCEIKASGYTQRVRNMSSNLAHVLHTLCSQGFVESVIVLILWCFHLPPAEFFAIQSFQLAPSQLYREAMTIKGLERTRHFNDELVMEGCCRLTTSS